MTKPIPKYLCKKNNLIIQAVFTAIFALVFINVYQPFESRHWGITQGISDFQYFFYSCLLILVGVAVVALGSTIKYHYSKKNDINYIQYTVSLAVEIFLISIVYTLIAYLLGDQRSFSDILNQSAINTALILLLPYTFSILYFAFIEKSRQLKTALDQDEKDKDTKNDHVLETISLRDAKGELRISIQRKYLMYIESADNYVYVHYLDKGKPSKFLIRNTMKFFESELQEYGIIRVHRTYIVNMSQVKLIKRETDGISLDLGVEGIKDIPCSKKYTEEVIKVFTS